MYDLHVHTTASDGTFTPQEVIDKAVEIGLSGMAITDHDTVDGLEIALKYRTEKKLDIDFIPGIEMNTEAYGKEIHILGYFIDYNDRNLNEKLKEIQEARAKRAHKIIARLKKNGMTISFSDVEKFAKGDLIGRPHIARALISQGYVGSIKEAFDRYIGKGRPAYEPRYKFIPQEAIDLIKHSGGICILAHPGLIEARRIIEQIINMGIEGLEVYYPEHSKAQIKEYTELCWKKNLLTTGGSDFHGTGSAENRADLGYTGISAKLMKRIYSYKKTNM